jgi:hypothetical protein
MYTTHPPLPPVGPQKSCGSLAPTRTRAKNYNLAAHRRAQVDVVGATALMVRLRRTF